MITRIGLIGLIIAATAFAPFAKGKGKGKGRGKGEGYRGGGSEYASYGYGGMSDGYYGNPGVALPPGLAKKGKIPPGWQKKLRAYPPDLDRRPAPLRDDWPRYR